MTDLYNNLPKIKMKTFSVEINSRNSPFYNIFKFMGRICKNIYNSTLFVYKIYLLYKNLFLNDIYKDICSDTTHTVDYVNFAIFNKLEYFYNLHTKKDSLIKHNNNILYKRIINKLESIQLNNNTYNDILQQIINENADIKFNNDYEYSFIINHILKNIYLKKYNKILYQIKNKIKIDSKDDIFIEQVKNGDNIFPPIPNYFKLIKEKFTKETDKQNVIKEPKIKSIHNIIRKFVFTKLDVNSKSVPAHVIYGVIEKVFNNISSYYSLREKGFFAKMCKYKTKNELFVVPFDSDSIKVINSGDSIRLTVGDYISKNYNKILNNNNYICINDNSKMGYRYYCDKKYLKQKQKNDKITKALNYIVKINGNSYYIDKTNKNIINGYYFNVKIPKNKINGKIKSVEINPLYNGRFFKLNIAYEVGLFSDNFIKKEKKPKQQSTEKSKKKRNKKIKVDVEELFKQKPPSPQNSISIDLGMVNLMTIYDPSGQQYIIKGNQINSLNSYYNYLIDNHRSVMYSLSKNSEYMDNDNIYFNNMKANIEKIKKVTIDNFMEHVEIYESVKWNKYRYKNPKKKIESLKKVLDYHKKMSNMKSTSKKMNIIKKTYYSLLKRRNNKINDYFNKLVKLLYEKYNEKDYIIIGYNFGWKTNVNIGKRNNRKFYGIHYSKLISKLKEKFGEKIIITEESYTSKCDALALEEIGKKETYLGKRSKRGLFKSSMGITINADLNGAINIMRKKIVLKKIEGKNLRYPTIIKLKNKYIKYNPTNKTDCIGVNGKKVSQI